VAQRVLLAVGGAALVAATFPLAAYLAAEAWSPGRFGFGLLLALPGLALVVRATRAMKPRRLAPLVPLGVGLLGLDVTDSARAVVVIAGYVCAGLGALAAVAGVVLLRRPIG
jgi:hypothetical protein